MAASQALPRAEKFAAAAGVTAPDLAVVRADGGRLQVLDRAPLPPADLRPQAEAAGTAVLAEDDVWEEKTPSGAAGEGRAGDQSASGGGADADLLAEPARPDAV